MGERSAIVVGGGIGGLATAVALLRRGWRVTVLERAPAFSAVGAGISLWPNAVRAMDAIGVGDAVRRLGGQELNGGIRHRSGRWLARTNSEEITRRFGEVMIMHRADLLRALVESLPSSSLISGAFVSAVSSTMDGVAVVYGDTTSHADLVVGADGLHSVIRGFVAPSTAGPRYAGYTAWRFITKDVIDLRTAGESWGAGQRFGYAGLPDGRVYCYATANVPEGACARDELDELRCRFGDWHQPIPSLLAAASPSDVLRHDIYGLPDLPSFVSGRVALVGDAAHAMTPDLGQGACQALEDAATLASCLDRFDVPSALVQYDAARRPRTQAVARLSRRIGDIGQWSSPVLVALRDRVIPLVPTFATTRSLSAVLDWTPPA